MIFIAAGSNLPFCGVDSQQLVLNAFSAMERIVRIPLASPLYRSPAWPDPADPPFVNAVASIETRLEPMALLAALHALEAGFGRSRGVKNAPRTLDLDLLAYGEERADGTDGPELPHPRLHERDFVLAPLCDIAPGWRHPVSGRTAQAMLDALPRPAARRIT